MKKGFTLVEVIVALTIMSIIGLMIVSVYATITNYGGKRNEKNNLKYAIHNIHECYLADPENWEINYFELYDLDFESLYFPEQVIYFNKDFRKISVFESQYAIYYDFDYTDEIYSLIITKIIRENTEIDNMIELGKWIKRT